MEERAKEVFFGLYCNSCKHENSTEDNDPCDECLATPSRPDSHKPIKWEEK